VLTHRRHRELFHTERPEFRSPLCVPLWRETGNGECAAQVEFTGPPPRGGV
jgi:hypothetical protein